MRHCTAKMQRQFTVLVPQILEIRSRYFHYHKHFKNHTELQIISFLVMWLSINTAIVKNSDVKMEFKTNVQTP